MTHLQLLALLCITGAAALVDARTGKIPNRLLGLGFVIALVVRVGLAVQAIDAEQPAALGWAALTALGDALVGMLACSVLPVALYQAGVLGGGDVKLLAVVGALIATGPGLELTLAALLVVGLYGVVLLAKGGRLSRSLARGIHQCKRLVTPGPHPPSETRHRLVLRFGPAVFIAAGCLALAHWPQAETGVSAAARAPLAGAQRSPHVVAPQMMFPQ